MDGCAGSQVAIFQAGQNASWGYQYLHHRRGQDGGKRRCRGCRGRALDWGRLLLWIRMFHQITNTIVQPRITKVEEVSSLLISVASAVPPTRHTRWRPAVFSHPVSAVDMVSGRVLRPWMDLTAEPICSLLNRIHLSPPIQRVYVNCSHGAIIATRQR